MGLPRSIASTSFWALGVAIVATFHSIARLFSECSQDTEVLDSHIYFLFATRTALRHVHLGVKTEVMPASSVVQSQNGITRLQISPLGLAKVASSCETLPCSAKVDSALWMLLCNSWTALTMRSRCSPILPTLFCCLYCVEGGRVMMVLFPPTWDAEGPAEITEDVSPSATAETDFFPLPLSRPFELNQHFSVVGPVFQQMAHLSLLSLLLPLFPLLWLSLLVTFVFFLCPSCPPFHFHLFLYPYLCNDRFD